MEIVTSLIYMRWMAQPNQRTLEIPTPKENGQEMRI